jgi:hypothetical protein
MSSRLLSGLFLLVLGFALVRLANPYVQGYRYEQLVRSEANDSRPHAESGAVHRRVMEQGRAMGFIIRDEDVQVERLIRGYQVRVHYAAPLDLLVYHTAIDFSFAARSGDTQLTEDQ